MNLSKKKLLAARTFNVGKARIMFVNSRLEEIKEAITKQDIRELAKDGAIIIKEVRGRKSNNRVKSRSVGNVRKNIKDRKRNYMHLVRKLRKHLHELKNSGKLSKEEVKKMRKRVRNKEFKSRNSLKEYLGGVLK